MTTYQYLGPAQGGPNTAALDETGLNTGNLTNQITSAFIGKNPPQFELYHATVTNVPSGGQAQIYVNRQLYSFVFPFQGSEYDPSQPLPLRPGDEIDFFWNIAAPLGGSAGLALSTQAGAFLDPGSMGVADFTAALAQWTGLGMPKPAAARYYLAASTFTYDTNMQEMVAAGIKICLTLRPAFSPVSATDRANMITLLQTLQTAGAVVDVALWHEPFFEGLSIAQYQAMIAYYGPAVRTYYPLVFVTSVQSVQLDNENAYYPGDGAVDKCATDFYAYDFITSGFNLTLAATPANNAVPPKPFGIWECNASTDPVVGQTSSQAASYFSYIQSFMAARRAAGQPNANVLFFNAGEHNLITGAQNQGFEGGVGSWTSFNCTLTDTAAQQHTGADSASLSSTAAGNMSIGLPTGTSGIPVTALATYTVAAWYRTAVTSRSDQSGVNWYNGAVFVSSSFPGATADNAAGWVQDAHTVTAPGTATNASPVGQVQATGGAAEVHYVDDTIFALQSVDASVAGFNFGSAPTSDFRIAQWSALAASLPAPAAAQFPVVTLFFRFDIDLPINKPYATTGL